MVGWLVLVSAWLCCTAGAQQSEPDEPSLLIRHVTLLKPESGQEEVLVNLILRDGLLEIVTLDAVDLDSVDSAVDAKGAFLIGKLEAGSAPSFILLSKDPRLDFDVLLDTNEYATFAVRAGTVVRNQLLQVGQEEGAEENERRKASGWLAYTPPPVMLPLDYNPTTKWNGWRTSWTNGAFIAALAIDRMEWQGQDSASQGQVGDLDAFDGGEIRALRFGAVGTLNFDKPWTYTAIATTHDFAKGFDSRRDDNLSLFDLRLDIPILAGSSLSLGKQKEPISLERLSAGMYMPMQERMAAVDALLPARNIGAVVSGTAADTDMSWAVGVFNNWLDSGGSISDNATQFIGRLTGLPAYSKDESNLLHLGIGLRQSNTKKPVAYSTEPEFDQAPDFISTGPIDADSSLTYGLEAAWLRGPFWLFGEYVWADVDAPGSGNPTIRGHALTAAYHLTGEMRSYNRRSGLFNPSPVAQSVHHGGWGTWEASMRWSNLDANDASIAGGEIDVYSLGLNWWLSRSFIASLNYRWIEQDNFGTTGHSHGAMLRIVMILD